MAQQQALLDSEVASFRQATFAESTQRTYLSQIRTFIRFCIYFGYTPVPASAETIVRYSVFLARTYVASSVKQYLNVVRIIHLDRGLKNPLEGSFHLKCVLKGITRMRGRAPERKLPITPVILRMFHRYLDVRNAYDVTFFAACVVAFFTFFRKSTLLSKSLKDHDPGKNLCRRDVEFSEQGVLISVKHNKTIQCHERSLKIPLMRTGCALCPVDALRTLWERFPDVPPHAPLFSYFVYGRLKCVAYTDFVKKVRNLVFRCGLKPDDYSGHSFEGVAVLGLGKTTCPLNTSCCKETGVLLAGYPTSRFRW